MQKKRGKNSEKRVFFKITEGILMLIFGFVEIRTKGSTGEILSILIERAMTFNRMQNISDGELIFRIYFFRFKEFKAIAHSRGLEFTEIKKGGLPALFVRFRKRYGLILGGLFLIFICIISELFVWDISISGSEKTSSSEILSNLQAYGIKKGAYISSLDLDGICAEYLLKNSSLSWIRINAVGNSLEVVVHEKELRPETQTDKPSSIIAKRDGYIIRLEVYGGSPLVGHGEAVLKNQPLVNGIVEQDNGAYRFERAKAKVFALVEDTFTVKIPMKESVKRYTGNVFEKKSLIFFSKSIKFSVLGRNSDMSCAIIEEDNGYLYETEEILDEAELLYGKILPVAIKTVRTKEYSLEEIPISESEARARANAELSEIIFSCLGKDGYTVSKKTVSYCRDGYYILEADISYVCDIASEIPLFK